MRVRRKIAGILFMVPLVAVLAAISYGLATDPVVITMVKVLKYIVYGCSLLAVAIFILALLAGCTKKAIKFLQ